MKKKYKHLTIEERYDIKEMLDNRKNITEIARYLKRSKCTISMEIRRNKKKRKYMPCIAEKKYRERLNKVDGLKIEKSSVLLKYVVDSLVIQKCAPNVIAGRLKLDDRLPYINISSESIYKFIYTSPLSKKLKLHEYLPSKRLNRQKRGKRKHRGKIPARVSIHERSAVASDKSEIGHYEADLTFHKGSQSLNIGCMVDKTTQKVFLVLNKSKSTKTVTSGFLQRMRVLPKSARRTFTMDNGKEFVNHLSYQKRGFKTYFCDPYRPRQKALVEKMNSMIHRILPKNIDLATISKRRLKHVENILNDMPRKIFGFKTPNEMWREYL